MNNEVKNVLKCKKSDTFIFLTIKSGITVII